MSTATHHDEPHKKQRTSEERSMGPLSSRTMLGSIALWHRPARECWFRKFSAFAERSSTGQQSKTRKACGQAKQGCGLSLASYGIAGAGTDGPGLG